MLDGICVYGPATRGFCEQNPEWFVVSHSTEQFGLNALGRVPSDKLESPIAPWMPGKGPGTELKKMLESIGITPSNACDCRHRANQMDVWGVDGCRKHFDTIVAWMREGQERWGWKERLSAAAKAVKSGLAFKLNPLDPFPSLIEEAIRRAEPVSPALPTDTLAPTETPEVSA